MYDFFSNNSIYIVLAIVVVIWIGFGSYVFLIESKLSKLEKKVLENNNDDL
jgi:CcmD family protein